MWVSFWIRYWSGTECCIKIKSVAMANIWCFIFDLCTPEKFNQEILNPKGLFLQYNSLYPIMYKQNAVYKNCFAGLGIRDFCTKGNSKTNLTNGLQGSQNQSKRITCWHPLKPTVWTTKVVNDYFKLALYRQVFFSKATFSN